MSVGIPNPDATEEDTGWSARAPGIEYNIAEEVMKEAVELSNYTQMR